MLCIGFRQLEQKMQDKSQWGIFCSWIVFTGFHVRFSRGMRRDIVINTVLVLSESPTLSSQLPEAIMHV